MKILSVVGTRPNFMKIAPLVKEFGKHNVKHVLVHTGQHYDREMSKLFFDELEIPKPDADLGDASHDTGVFDRKQEVDHNRHDADENDGEVEPFHAPAQGPQRGLHLGENEGR